MGLLPFGLFLVSKFCLIWAFISNKCQPLCEDLLQSERLFEQAMKKECGYIVRKMKNDGACLFRAVGKK